MVSCWKNLLLNLKVHSAAKFNNNLLKISFEQIGLDFLLKLICSIIELIVSSIRMLVNNRSASYDTSPSSSCNGGIEDVMLRSFCVSLMEYSFLHKGLK